MMITNAYVPVGKLNILGQIEHLPVDKILFILLHPSNLSAGIPKVHEKL